MTEPMPPRFEVFVPDDQQAGVYSNLVSVWHTPYEFTLDFTVMQQAHADDDGAVHVPSRVVSRVRLPPAQIFELLKALNANMTAYEEKFGAIEAPGGAES